MPGEREWLQAEQSGQEDIAEAMFARLIANMPPIEPGTAFVDRTARAAWRARRRRRLVTRFARVAAALLLGITMVGSLYEVTVLAVGLIARGAIVVSHGFVWFLTAASEGARWWSVAARVGTAVSDAITSPLTIAAVAAVEMTVLLGMYALRRLVQNESEVRESRKVPR